VNLPSDNTSDYALRCSNEDQIIRSTEEILRLMGL